MLLGHFLPGLQEDGTIPYPVICISLVIYAIQRSILASTSPSSSVLIAASRVVIISFGVKSSIPAFQLRRSEIFLPIF
jgi:hypothetical protein